MLKTEEFIQKIEEDIPAYKLDGKFIPNDYGYKLLKKSIDESGIKKAKIVSKITPTDKNGYKYLNNKREMQRNILIKICIVCEFDLNLTNKLLRSYRFLELYPKIKQEYIIIQGIQKQLDLNMINEMLANENEMKL